MAENKAPREVEAEPRRRDADLMPFEPAEGSGQRLGASERASAEARAELEAARADADKTHQDAQARIRAKQRELAEAELRKQRDEAMATVDQQAEQYEAMAKRMPGGGMVFHPAMLELEAARVRAVADALQQDETVPGGCYIVDGKLVDADGRPLE